MDVEVLKIFLEEAEGYLPSMRRGIIAYEQDASRLAELQESRRQAHAIKGSALMLKKTEIGEIAKDIESELKKVIREKNVLNENQANEFLSKILILESHLKDLRAGLNAALPADEKPSGKPNKNFQTAETAIELPEESFAKAEEDFEIDAEMLEVFACEAEDLLRNIGVNLAFLEKSPQNREALLEIRRSSHTLKGSAGIIGLKKLSALAHRIEDLLDFLAENKMDADKQIFAFLQAAFDCLSLLANNESSPQLNKKIERVYQNCDEVFEKLKAGNNSLDYDAEAVQTADSSKSAPEVYAENDEPPIIEKAEKPLAETADASRHRSVIRVSLERLNDLFNLAGEMMINRSVFEQRLNELERQIGELQHTTRRFRASTDKIEINFAASPTRLQSRYSHSPNIFQASSEPVFDELEFDRYTEFHQTTHELIEAASDASAINSGLDQLLDNLNSVFDNQRRLIEEMQNNLLRLRMISLSSLAPRLQRTVSATAEEEEKLVDFIIENDRLEIDAEIMDAIVEPLIHLLRNAVAHGIESPEARRSPGKSEAGKIVLRVFNEGAHLVFSVEDDGRGICVSALKEKAVQGGFISKREADAMPDADAFSLVFLPGLTTAEKINQVSGRGVGMNIVKTAVSRRQGTISVKSEAGRGTIFTVRLPVSLAVMRALLVRAAAQMYAFPLNLIKQVTEISKTEFDKAVENKSLEVGGISYSFSSLNEMLGLPATPCSSDSPVQILLLKTPETPCALAVDRILKTEEIVIKPLGALFKNIRTISGATILGDGNVVPVLDLIYLFKNPFSSGNKNKSEIQNPESKILRVLIIDDSPSVRLVNSNLIKKAGWTAETARDGMEALEILQAPGEPPDVILTDVEMPRMDGYELLAAIKKQSNLARIPVIMITSRAGDKHRRKAFDLGTDDYLSKPYEDAVLLDKIKALTK